MTYSAQSAAVLLDFTENYAACPNKIKKARESGKLKSR